MPTGDTPIPCEDKEKMEEKIGYYYMEAEPRYYKCNHCHDVFEEVDLVRSRFQSRMKPIWLCKKCHEFSLAVDEAIKLKLF